MQDIGELGLQYQSRTQAICALRPDEQQITGGLNDIQVMNTWCTHVIQCKGYTVDPSSSPRSVENTYLVHSREIPFIFSCFSQD